MKLEELVSIYRVVTGSCGMGVNDFIESNNIEDKKYTINEMIDITDKQYGNQQLKEYYK